jgi:hypothetical protein
MSDGNQEGGKRRFPRGRRGRKRLTYAELRDAFLDWAQAEPSKDEIKQVHEMVNALIAVAGMERAYELEKIKELERMVGVKEEEGKQSFTDEEKSRRKPSGFGRGE